MTWSTDPVEEIASVTLEDWSIFEINVIGKKTRHFVGYNANECEGRVSSAIQNFDSITMNGTTNSGRVYHLSGESGQNADAEYVWKYWKKVNEIEENQVKDLTQYYDRTKKANSI